LLFGKRRERRAGSGSTGVARLADVQERERRLAANEAYFRDFNERVEEAVKEVGGNVTFNIVCECASVTCAERLRVTPAEYEEIRGDPRQFIVATGHGNEEIEDTVMRRAAYDVVRKRGEAGEVAEDAARG
jgi:hypothetical protein